MLQLLLLCALPLAQASRTPDASPPIPAAADGSLWDYIEAPSDADAHDRSRARRQSRELARARYAEDDYIRQAREAVRVPTDFYRDPAGHMADDPLYLSQIDPRDFDIPVVVNADVIRWMKYFTGRGRRTMGKWLGRGGKYWPMMYEKLDAKNAPRDLVYLSMIESGYATHAYSSASAVGLWQFIRSTGRMYDLRVDWWVDERRDPELATDAAIAFLTELHGKYGDWYLAWSAYNAGPGRVNKAIRKHGTRDFWQLSAKKGLPKETRNYVPKLLAAAIIGKYPERYGFTDVKPADPIQLDTVTVPANVSLDVLAKCADVSVDEFRAINPKLRRWALPPSPAKHTVHVPRKRGKKFLAKLDKIPEDKRITHLRHTVKKGETLATIGRKHRVSSKAIQRVNKIKNPNRIKVGTNLVIPKKGGPSDKALADTHGSSKKKRKRSSTRTKKSRPSAHTVRPGETLSGIANKYKVKTTELKSWNGLKSSNTIRVGQKLSLKSNAVSKPQWSSYTVRRGDSLSAIAKRHRCSIADLKKWNKLKSTQIRTGQKLKVQKG
jgi:membrane-bound lytic murein transglycosylase D